MSDWKKLREAAEAATHLPTDKTRAVDMPFMPEDVGDCWYYIEAPDGTRYAAFCAEEDAEFCAASNPTAILALLADNDSLRAEVERLRKTVDTGNEAFRQVREQWRQQLSAALAAKEEACEIALQWAAHLRDLHGDPQDRVRIVELRTIGKDDGND